MKKAAFVLIASALSFATLAEARERWQGPGWYQVLERTMPGRDAHTIIYLNRPFASREECMKTLLDDYTDSGLAEHTFDTVHDFSCVLLTSKPHWDR